MKSKILLVITMLLLCFSVNTKAAFPTHKVEAAAQSESDKTGVFANENESSTSATAVVVESKTIQKKHGFWNSLLHRLGSHKAVIAPILYIILAILPFGWLGMGPNDNFKGNRWLIGLILNLLFWLPGIIYALVMYRKYY